MPVTYDYVYPDGKTYTGLARDEILFIDTNKAPEQIDAITNSLVNQIFDTLNSKGAVPLRITIGFDETADMFKWSASAKYYTPTMATAVTEEERAEALILPALLIPLLPLIISVISTVVVGLIIYFSLGRVVDIIWSPPEVREKFPWASVIIPIGIAIAIVGVSIYLLKEKVLKKK